MATADWYDDPLDRYSKRYFDGTQWTAHVSERGVASVDPLGIKKGPRASAAAPAPMLGPNDQPHATAPQQVPPSSVAPTAYPAVPSSAAPVAATPPGYTAWTPTMGSTQPVATMGVRFGARVIDVIISTVISYVLVFGILFAGLSTESGEGALAGLLGAMLAALLFGVLWEVLWVAKKGGTPGKLMLGIRIVDARTGELLSGGSSFVRFIIPAIGGVFFYIGALLVYLSPLFDSSGRNQGWHDRAANDLVITTK